MNRSYMNYYHRGNSISLSLQASIALIGLISNTSAICVFGRKSLKKHSYSFYWRVRAFFDNLTLLHFFRHCVRHFLNVDIDLMSPFLCRINEYQPYVFSAICLWIECVITVDRFLTIAYPNRFILIKQRCFQIAIISIIAAYSTLASINLPFNYRLDRVIGSNDTWICHAPTDSLKLNWTVGLINVLVVNLVINPFLDLKIICKIVSTRGNIRRMSRTALIDRKFALSAIGLNISSLVLKLPFIACNLLSIAFGFNKSETEVAYSICLILILVGKIDVFFVNFIVNSVFRREFFALFGYDLKSNNNSSNNSNNNFNNSARLSNELKKNPIQETATTMTMTNSSRVAVEAVELLRKKKFSC